MLKKIYYVLVFMFVFDPAALHAQEEGEIKVIGTIDGIDAIIEAYLPDRPDYGAYPPLIPTKKVYDAIHAELPNYKFGSASYIKRDENKSFFWYYEELGEEIRTLDDAKAWIMLANCAQLVAEGKNNESWNGNLLTDTPRFVDLKKFVEQIRALFPEEKTIQAVGASEPLVDVQISWDLFKPLNVHPGKLDGPFMLSQLLQDQLQGSVYVGLPLLQKPYTIEPYNRRDFPGDEDKWIIFNIVESYPNEYKYDSLPFAVHMLVMLNLLDLYDKAAVMEEAFATFDGDILSYLPVNPVLKAASMRIRELYKGIRELQTDAQPMKSGHYLNLEWNIYMLKKKIKDQEIDLKIEKVNNIDLNSYKIGKTTEELKAFIDRRDLMNQARKALDAQFDELDKKLKMLHVMGRWDDKFKDLDDAIYQTDINIRKISGFLYQTLENNG